MEGKRLGGGTKDYPYFYLIMGRRRMTCRTLKEMLFFLSFEKCYWILVQKYGSEQKPLNYRKKEGDQFWLSRYFW